MNTPANTPTEIRSGNRSPTAFASRVIPATPTIIHHDDHLWKWHWYRPQVFIISENKDTALHFPELPGGVSIEGVGRGGSTAAAFEWIVEAPRIFYWGDMDADGLEILDGFRAAGVSARSILMNPVAYVTWERFGTNVDQYGRPLGPRLSRPVPHLTEVECALYQQLISSSWTRYRRIEQERIPLDVAVEQVRELGMHV